MRDAVLSNYQRIRHVVAERFLYRLAVMLRWLESPFGSTLTFASSIGIVVALAVLSACTSLTSPQTFNEKAAVALSSVTALRNTTTTLLTARKITAADAQNVQNQLNTAREAIDIARSVATSDPKAASDKLSAALAIVTALQTYVATRGT